MRLQTACLEMAAINVATLSLHGLLLDVGSSRCTSAPPSPAMLPISYVSRCLGTQWTVYPRSTVFQVSVISRPQLVRGPLSALAPHGTAPYCTYRRRMIAREHGWKHHSASPAASFSARTARLPGAQACCLEMQHRSRINMAFRSNQR